MNFRTILSKAVELGGSVLADAVPWGNTAIKLVNEVLPQDKQLPTKATGDDLAQAVAALPPEQRASLLEKRVDLEIIETQEWTKVFEAATKADASGSSTRPKIAMMMSWAVLAVVLPLGWSAAYAAIKAANADDFENFFQLGMFALAVIATPVAVVKHYFGARTQDKANRISGATGINLSQKSLIEKILN